MKIYGIFGFPLAHTLSPAMHEAAFAKLGLDACYLPFELAPRDFLAVARDFRRTRLAGFNLTVPYKERVLPYLSSLAPEARAVGAVNTVKRIGPAFRGYNTDCAGFTRSLREAGFPVVSKRAVVLGAGGAARACVYGLLREGIRDIAILNRHPEKAVKIVRRFKTLFRGVSLRAFPLKDACLKPALESADLLLNTTSVGLKKSDPALVREDLWPDRKLWVCDLIYNPEMTPLLEAARKKRCRILNGKAMLLYQGAAAFEIWTGRKAPEKIMRKAFETALKAKPS